MHTAASSSRSQRRFPDKQRLSVGCDIPDAAATSIWLTPRASIRSRNNAPTARDKSPWIDGTPETYRGHLTIILYRIRGTRLRTSGLSVAPSKTGSMGRKVNNRGAAEYAARVQKNVEDAVQHAGFDGWVCQSGPLTIECLARVSAVLNVNFDEFFPRGDLRHGSARSASQQTGTPPVRHRSGQAHQSRWLPSLSATDLGATG